MPLDQLVQTIEAAVDEGVPRDAVRVDFGLARGIAYYTGMVFDLVADGSGAAEGLGRSLGGGGRYDGLPRALGAASEFPALGFAYNLETILSVAPQEAAAPPGRRVLVAPADATGAGAAARHAAKLRSEGVTALLETEAGSPEEMRACAKAQGASEIAVVSDDGAVRMEALQ